MTSTILLSSIIDWTWPENGHFRFFLLQFIFWIGYFYLVGLIGSAPFALTRFRANAWTTLVLGAMGTLIACLSQAFFNLETSLDMASPYAIVVSIVSTGILTPVLSLFLFICQGADGYDDYYDDEENPRHFLYMRRIYGPNGNLLRLQDQKNRIYQYDDNGAIYHVKSNRYVDPRSVRFEEDDDDERGFVDPRYAQGAQPSEYGRQPVYKNPRARSVRRR